MLKTGTSYNFYVLSYNDENKMSTNDKTKAVTTNLINMCDDGTPTEASKEAKCLVAYNESGDSADGGPVTAMTYLNNATSTWENISNLNITYDDEGENFIGFILKGKSRLPYRSEVDAFNNNNGYLFENLHSGNWSYAESTKPKNNISGIYGYWTLSSYAVDSANALFVTFDGYVLNGNLNVGYTDSVGVRPVISVRL